MCAYYDCWRVFHLCFSKRYFCEEIGVITSISSRELGAYRYWRNINLPAARHRSPQVFLGQRLKWLSIPIAKVFGHRGITNSFLAIVGCSIFLSSDLLSRIIIPIPVDFVHAMVVGYISHVGDDMLTPAGIRLLWPYRRRFCMPILNPSKYPKWGRIFCVLVLVCAFLYPFDILISNKLLVTDSIQNIWQWSDLTI